jgi:hypothetical protein
MMGRVTCTLELFPVDADVDEAEHVAHQDEPQGNQREEIGFVRDFELQHHGGDDAVAEASSRFSHRFANLLFKPQRIKKPVSDFQGRGFVLF